MTKKSIKKSPPPNNYRIEFEKKGKKTKPPKGWEFSLEGADKYYPTLEKIYNAAKKFDVYIWHHFEPYVELTIWNRGLYWNDKLVQKLIQEIRAIIKKDGLKIIKVSTPKNGFFADWYYENEQEARFGIESMDLTAKLSMTFWKYRTAIKKGKGKDRMLMRRFHVLCNQLGVDYVGEGSNLFRRGLFAIIAASCMNQEKAVKVYESIIGNKY